MVYIYIIMGILMCLLTIPSNNKIEYYTRIALCILLFSCIMGCRYNVGKDYLPTLEIYQMRADGFDHSYLESYNFLFRKATEFFADNNFHFSFYFGFIAFLQILFFFIAVKDYKDIIPYITIFFVLECTWLTWANAMRQSIGYSLFLIAVHFLARKKIISYAVLIFVAALFHESALELLFLIPLCRKNELFKNRKIQLILFAMSTLIFISRWNGMFVILYFIEPYISADFQRYYYSGAVFAPIQKFGVGFWCLFFINLIIIINSNKIKAYYNSKWLNKIYDLFFIGVIVEYVFLANQLVGRFNMFFIQNRFILSGFYLYYFIFSTYSKYAKDENNSLCNDLIEGKRLRSISRMLGCILLFFNCLIFYGYLSKYKDDDNTIAYHFFWTEQL